MYTIALHSANSIKGVWTLSANISVQTTTESNEIQKRFIWEIRISVNHGSHRGIFLLEIVGFSEYDQRKRNKELKMHIKLCKAYTVKQRLTNQQR